MCPRCACGAKVTVSRIDAADPAGYPTSPGADAADGLRKCQQLTVTVSAECQTIHTTHASQSFAFCPTDIEDVDLKIIEFFKTRTVNPRTQYYSYDRYDTVFWSGMVK